MGIGKFLGKIGCSIKNLDEDIKNRHASEVPEKRGNLIKDSGYTTQDGVKNFTKVTTKELLNDLSCALPSKGWNPIYIGGVISGFSNGLCKYTLKPVGAPIKFSDKISDKNCYICEQIGISDVLKKNGYKPKYAIIKANGDLVYDNFFINYKIYRKKEDKNEPWQLLIQDNPGCPLSDLENIFIKAEEARKEAERRAEEARKEAERRAEEARKEAERKAEEEKARRKEAERKAEEEKVRRKEAERKAEEEKARRKSKKTHTPSDDKNTDTEPRDISPEDKEIYDKFKIFLQRLQKANFEDRMNMFGLSLSMQKSDASKAYKKDMNMYHSDKFGSNHDSIQHLTTEITKILNDTFEKLKKHHNWK